MRALISGPDRPGGLSHCRTGVLACPSRLRRAFSAARIDGLTSDEAAFILALGFVLGTFPMYGLPTLLCALAAAALRLNFPALQLVNNLSSPLQLALLIPFAKIGSWILGRPAAWSLSGAIAGWLVSSVPAGVILYLALVCVFRGQRGGWFNKLESPA